MNFNISRNLVGSFIMILAILSLSSCLQKSGTKKTSASNDYSEQIMGLSFSQAEWDSMQSTLDDQLKYYEEIRKTNLKNSVPPALLFNPLPIGFEIPGEQKTINWGKQAEVKRPADMNALAFYSLHQLSYLVRTRQITSLELTHFFLDRLKKYGDTLKCVITLTEELALKQAAEADREIAAGHYRGPLHGIPYGLKDLIAVKGYPTTWGAVPYKDQLIDQTATVAKKLEDAGAVLCAKLSLGALAMDDVWFGGMTRNPWDLKQGSSGSSAGSAASVSAGLLPFALGSETWGSIVSPCTRCGVTGLRPTFGRVSRAGCMALSWSMDKIGAIARSAEDCALVFEAIRGSDGLDPTVTDAAFNYNANRNLHDLRIAYFEDLFGKEDDNRMNDSISLILLQKLGVKLIPVKLPSDLPVEALSIILSAEAGAAFNDLTLSHRDSLLVMQSKISWPNIFRASRFIPAVEYVQANRIRTELINEFDKLFENFDVIITPSFAGDQLLLTNLTGNPCVVVPNGFDKDQHPTSISFIGRLFDEASVIEAAKAYQDASIFDEQHPKMFLK